MRNKIQKWGNSLALRIPKAFAEETGLMADSPVEITVVDGRLVITPVQDCDLDTLLRGITEGNLHNEIDTGLAAGNEAW